MLSRDYYRIQILKINTARINLWPIGSKRGKWWTKYDLSIGATPLSNRNGSGTMHRSWNPWIQHLYQMPRTPSALSGWGSRMYFHCPHLVARRLSKATPADLSLGWFPNSKTAVNRTVHSHSNIAGEPTFLTEQLYPMSRSCSIISTSTILNLSHSDSPSYSAWFWTFAWNDSPVSRFVIVTVCIFISISLWSEWT